MKIEVTGSIAQMLEQQGIGAEVQEWDALGDRWKSRLQPAISPETRVSCLVSPQTQTDLAAAIACISSQGWQILPCGRGSKLDWGGIVGSSRAGMPIVAVTTEHLNRLVEHAVGDLTVTVEAGMGFAGLQATLAKEGQFLAIDPAYPEQATLGGIVATADTGSLRQRYSGVRDMLLGLSFVRADGAGAKAGGRVVKNVAGYDLMKLFTGSYGTLGIITQLTFRVYPLPEASESVVLFGAAGAIAQATSTLLSSALTPVSADVLSPKLVEALGIGQGTGLAVRFQSIAPSVQEQISRLVEVGQALDLSHAKYGAAADADLWERLRERMTIAPNPSAIACKIGIQPAAAIALLDLMDQLSISSWTAQIHAASGLGRLMIADTALRSEVITKIRTFCQTHQGFLTVVQAPGSLKQQVDVWGYGGNAIAVMRDIKHQFDPKSLLSPHRFVGGI